MPVWKNRRTGNTVSADEEYIAALGAEKYEQVAEESADERRAREVDEARAAKVELDDGDWDTPAPSGQHSEDSA